MSLQLNEPWLTDKTSTGGSCVAATPAERTFKPNNATAGAAETLQSHLELRLGMPTSYPSPPDHHSPITETMGRSATTTHGCAAVLFAAHGTKHGGGVRAAPLQQCYHQMPPGPSSTSGLGAKRWFSETASAVPSSAAAAGVGFVHPWSLAARQEKAALEQAARAQVANKQPASSTLLAAVVSRPTEQTPVVGWPPIRTYRKNAIANPRIQKPATVGDEKEAKKSKPCADEEKQAREGPKPSSLFVKVNMDGFAVGRKIDLLAHDGYESLSCALHGMFDNFLSVKNAGTGSEKDIGQSDAAISPELVLLYEDNEGDRMLVGDVPWEMFVGSVKRLYISINPKLHAPVEEDEEKNTRQNEAVLTSN